MVPTVLDVAHTAMYLEVVISQAGSVLEAVNLDGLNIFVIKESLFHTTKYMRFVLFKSIRNLVGFQFKGVKVINTDV